MPTLGMTGVGHFIRGFFMTGAAVFRGYQDGDQFLDLFVIVDVGVDIALLSRVAFILTWTLPVCQVILGE
jgi:hypothetical protein